MTELKVTQEQFDQIKQIIGGIGDEVTIKVGKPKKWEPPARKFRIDGDFVVFQYYLSAATESYIKAGMTRDTKEQAEADAKELRAFARLLAYRAEVAPGFHGTAGWYVQKSGPFWEIYIVESNWYSPGNVVFPTEELAEECARKLNAGELEL